jgi:hypothetical protein
MTSGLDDLARLRIEESLKGMRYGTVEITVHDGQIVQIERRERIRMDLRKSSDPARRRPPGDPGCRNP